MCPKFFAKMILFVVPARQKWWVSLLIQQKVSKKLERTYFMMACRWNKMKIFEPASKIFLCLFKHLLRLNLRLVVEFNLSLKCRLTYKLWRFTFASLMCFARRRSYDVTVDSIQLYGGVNTNNLFIFEDHLCDVSKW